MNDLKKRIKNIKYWRRWNIFGVLLIAMGIVPIILTEMYNSMIAAISALNETFSLLVGMMFALSPFVGMYLLYLGVHGQKEQIIYYSKCNSKIMLKDLEAMDKFLCPYCLNDTFKPAKKSSLIDERTATRSVLRGLGRTFKK